MALSAPLPPSIHAHQACSDQGRGCFELSSARSARAEERARIADRDTDSIASTSILVRRGRVGPFSESARQC